MINSVYLGNLNRVILYLITTTKMADLPYILQIHFMVNSQFFFLSLTNKLGGNVFHSCFFLNNISGSSFFSSTSSSKKYVIK